MTIKIFSLAFILLLTACAAQNAVCPSLREYTPAEEDQIYIAMSGLSVDNPLRSAMDDYATLRNQIKACQAEQ